MSAPTLSIKEQRASISGRKKKKTMKNVLNIPGSLKVESQCVDVTEARKLMKILERLLPSARLPIERNDKSKKNTNEQTIKDSQLKVEAQRRRNQLSLGVNALNRTIKQGLISAVLFANDIQPNFLIHHLCLLCNHNKIPFLQMPGLREITKNHLGFPCIAVGFKKDFCDFSEAVEEVKSISQTKRNVSEDKIEETVVESSDSDECVNDNKIFNNCVKSVEIPFKYLYRTSKKERVFNPESNNHSKQKVEAEFITVENEGNDSVIKNHITQLGISKKFLKAQKKKLNVLEKLKGNVDDDDDDDDDEDNIKVPRKKIKKDWVIDKAGERRKINYYPTNLVRFSSNPDRNSRKNINRKKN